jgi:putative ABC transport system permease protein
MFRDNFRLAIRSLLRLKGYTLLNIFSLGIGMAIFMIIVLFIYHELSTDRHHENYHRIYRVETHEYPVTNSLTASFLATVLPEAMEICRYYRWGSNQLSTYNGRQTNINQPVMVDSTFFDIFSVELLHGDPVSALNRPMTIVLSVSEVQKIFGDEHPIGRTILVNNIHNFEVTGVMADFPPNSTLQATALISFPSLITTTGDPRVLEGWRTWNYFTFVLLPEKHDLAAINIKVTAGVKHLAVENFGPDDGDVDFFLRPFKDIYFDRNIPFDSLPKGNLVFLTICLGIGVFILLIAMVNFINLSTAMAFRRSREVGLKKVLGSTRVMLMKQYLTESAMLGLISLVLALLLFELLLPVFNNITGMVLTFSLSENLHMLLLTILFALLVGMIAGIYPALYISRFQPAEVLKGAVTRGRRGSILRKVLIVFQFSVSIGIIFSTIVLFSQMEYTRKKDLGFSSENIIYFRRHTDITKHYDAFKQALKQIPGVELVGLSSHVPGYSNMAWERFLDSTEVRINALLVDTEYLDVYGLKLALGRGFDPGMTTEMDRAFILNETAVRTFGLEEPIGVRFWDGKVIGVIEDFTYTSLHHPIGPLVLGWMPGWASEVSVKLSGNDLPRIINQLEQVWKSFAPDYPFRWQFLDESIGQLYEKEKRLSKLFLAFSMLAVFLACLGLSGLALFTTQQRTREVSVRKVFGSSSLQVLFLFTGDFLRYVLLANIIAWLVAWFIMNRWLENFAYRISISWWMFVVSAVLALVIALATIILQALNAARINPAEALKHE